MSTKKKTKYVLKRDIVIPAGTEFQEAPTKTERSRGEYVEAVFGLTCNTAGTVTYDATGPEIGQIFDIRES